MERSTHNVVNIRFNRRPARAAAGPGGLTLLEIMITLLIMMIAVLPMISLFSSASSEISATVEEIFLVAYANELIDSILTTGFDKVPVEAKEDNVDSSSVPFFRELAKKYSKIKDGFSRSVVITTENLLVDESALEDVDPYSKARFEKIMSFKVIEASANYRPAAGRHRSIKICSLHSPE